ncbi:hypothetical protein ACQPYK_03760 [Streptosporangium sp. CA-135522]|uniref:hypothetical protein n=1 Tax=Streptosporangium sp. CA-135522 TaxID=3240072 RepID=UPI003D8A7985
MVGIAELIGPEVDRATPAALVRGGELERSGAVQLVRFSPSLVTAEVDDGAARVEFRAVDGAMRWYCTCAEGRDGVFCAHCVATAQSVRRRTERKASPGASSATASASTVRIAS